MKRYEFWFCHNLMYNEQTIKRVRSSTRLGVPMVFV